jgi:hypothetical protein
MKILRFDEPELQFGTSTHVDIRFGLMNYSPLDFDSAAAPKRIRVGIVGNASSIEGLRDWLERCRNEIPAKQSRQPNLFPKFPGFRPDTAFCSELIFDSALERPLSSAAISDIIAGTVRDEQKVRAVTAIVGEVRNLLERKPDVVVCALPPELLDAFEPDDDSVDLDNEQSGSSSSDTDTIDFHHFLKAR